MKITSLVRWAMVGALLCGCNNRIDTKEHGSANSAVPQVTILRLIGDVHIRQPGERVWQRAHAGTRIGQGTIVRTADESSITLEFPHQGQVVLSETGLLSVNIERMPDSTLSSAVNLRSGIVLAVLRDMVGGRRSSFRVRTPTVTATIRGTSFKTQVDALSGAATVMVLQGAVAVKTRQYRHLSAQGLVPDSSLAIAATAAASADDLVSLDKVINALESDWEYDIEKKVQSATLQYRQELAVQRAQGTLAVSAFDSLLTHRENVLRATLSPPDTTPSPIIATAGTVVEAAEQSAAMSQRNYQPQELIQIQQLFSDTLVQRALKPNPSSVSSPDSLDIVQNRTVFSETLRIATLPDTVVVAGQEFVYTPRIDAVRSEAVRFVVVEGPPGMAFDAAHHTLRWNPLQECSTKVCVAALGGVDTLAGQCFGLVVQKPLELGFAVHPQVGDTTTRYTITPTVCDNVKIIRVDFEGDGIWDTTVNKAEVLSHRYSEPGIYEMRCEARGGHEQRREQRSRVSVDIRPQAQAAVTPPIIMPGGVARFDGGGSADNQGVVGYRWDIDDDGVWEYPPQGYSQSSAVEHQFYRREQGQAVVEVIDNVGLTAQARVDYKVGYPCRARAFEVEPVNLVQSALLRGEGSDMDDSLVWYGWDFEGDGVVDWESDSTMQTTHRYEHEGVYRAVFMIRSADGSSAQAHTAVTVVNESPQANAGDEQVSVVNEECRFVGSGVDVDGKIVQYSWDFDGNRKIDFTSAESAAAVFVYTEKGVYKPVLTVTSADGQVAKAVTTVRVVSRLGLVMKR